MNTFNKDIMEINNIIFNKLKNNCTDQSFNFRVIRQLILLCSLFVFNKKNLNIDSNLMFNEIIEKTPYYESVMLSSKKVKLSMKQKIFVLFARKKCIKLLKIICTIS